MAPHSRQITPSFLTAPESGRGSRQALWLTLINCYYFRLWVDNHGKTRAERVQVFATKLHRLGADGKFVEDKHFLPLNLRWSHSEDHPEVFAEGISPHMGKHCDLGRIIDFEKRADFADIEGFAQEK